MSSISLESLLKLINNEQVVKQRMAQEAATIVHDNTQLMQGVTTHPSSVMQEVLASEGERLSKPDVAIETGVVKHVITSPDPIFSYANDENLEDEMFNAIVQSINEIHLPRKITVERSMYLRDRPSKKEGWFAFDQQLDDQGYGSDFGGIHEINYVLARLTGFHKLERSEGKGRLMWSHGRDILLSSLLYSEAEVFKNNKEILDSVLK
jgi:hypothetical protein